MNEKGWDEGKRRGIYGEGSDWVGKWSLLA